MKVKLEFYRAGSYNGRCVITREAKDMKFHSESALLYHVKNILNGQGQDLVKKIMSKDGHMVGDNYGPHYLRDRAGRFGIYDADYAVRNLVKVLNEYGMVTITVSDLREKD